MSSPDHPTANLEDAFSSNFPNYVPPASPDYVPASPGKTYSSASNSFGIVPLTSPTLSLFPDDPYMKVLQAFYTEKSPIPASNYHTLKHQDFFLPARTSITNKNHLSLPRSTSNFLRWRKLSKVKLSSVHPPPPRRNQILRRILNSLDAIPIERIEHIENGMEGLGKGTRKQIGLQPENFSSRYRIAELEKLSTTWKMSQARTLGKSHELHSDIQNRME
ncbi:hypothetical protein Tco_0127847 [Tanacetum coccineum]|uniref:Uncharacterized protein n=1 Tax=Tanacetum coccineum TaxID=301880 RepID=A0ABQ5FCL4_9ASTR